MFAGLRTVEPVAKDASLPPSPTRDTVAAAAAALMVHHALRRGNDGARDGAPCSAVDVATTSDPLPATTDAPTPPSAITTTSSRPPSAPRAVFYDFVPTAGAPPPPRWGAAAASVGASLVIVGGVGAAVFNDAWSYGAAAAAWARLRTRSAPSHTLAPAFRRSDGPGAVFGAAAAA